MALTSSVALTYRSSTSDVVELASLTATINESRTHSFASGTDDYQCDLAWSDQMTLADGGTSVVNLASLTDTFGVAMTFAKIRAIVIENNSTTQLVTIGGAVADTFDGLFGATADTMVIQPDSAFVLESRKTGYTVDATHKNLQFENSAGDTAAINIWIVGTSV